MARWVPAADGGLGAWLYCCLYQKSYRPIGYCSLECRHREPAEAAEHYREYLLDQATYDGRWHGVYYRCELCGEWTDSFAQVPSAFIIHRLCRSHLNRNGLGRVLTVAELGQDRPGPGEP